MSVGIPQYFHLFFFFFLCFVKYHEEHVDDDELAKMGLGASVPEPEERTAGVRAPASN